MACGKFTWYLITHIVPGLNLENIILSHFMHSVEHGTFHEHCTEPDIIVNIQNIMLKYWT